ncbi:MAG: sulfatase [Phycisphaerae bacterium]|nr:MAG: sulfatase [Phycisphaerae bacterium]
MNSATNSLSQGRRNWLRLLAMICLMTCCTLASSCKQTNKQKSSQPNVLFIVLDTTRADRLGLYGHHRPTTPFLDEWAKKALVFEDCLSASSTTVPSHASMFTGLLPSTHLTDNSHPTLDDKYETLAEILGKSGYRSFLFSANPFVAADNNFDQGFDVTEHPWSDQHITKSADIIRAKIDPTDKSSDLPRKFQSGQVADWAIKACGEVAEGALTSWLDRSESDKPYFAFINYMEAHRPLLPPRRIREKFMTKAQIARSYKTDVSWARMWEYVFDLFDYRREEEEVIDLTYDAAIAELDEILKSLLTTVEQRGELDNTLVIITADHGEHLCEHHLLDHQYSLYQPLLKVPMILWHPSRVTAGRNSDPVANIDVFPTILELADIASKPTPSQHARSLMQTTAQRVRHSDYFSPPTRQINEAKRIHRSWNPKPFLRKLRAVVDGNYKLIWSSDQDHALYDLSTDPGEKHNLFNREPEIATAILAQIIPAAKRGADGSHASKEPHSAGHAQRMTALGYAGSDDSDVNTTGVDTNGTEWQTEK